MRGSATTVVFVYGTLKRGYCREYALKGQEFLDVAHTTTGYRMFDLGNYPGLIADNNGMSIQGELWEVDADCLAFLDEIEDVASNHYRRADIRLAPPHNELPVVAYFYQGSVSGLRDCGVSY